MEETITTVEDTRGRIMIPITKENNLVNTNNNNNSINPQQSQMLGKTNKRSFRLHWQDWGLSAADSKILTQITEFKIEKTDSTFIEAKNIPMEEAKRDFNNSVGLDLLWSGAPFHKLP